MARPLASSLGFRGAEPMARQVNRFPAPMTGGGDCDMEILLAAFVSAAVAAAVVVLARVPVRRWSLHPSFQLAPRGHRTTPADGQPVDRRIATGGVPGSERRAARPEPVAAPHTDAVSARDRRRRAPAGADAELRARREELARLEERLRAKEGALDSGRGGRHARAIAGGPRAEPRARTRPELKEAEARAAARARAGRRPQRRAGQADPAARARGRAAPRERPRDPSGGGGDPPRRRAPRAQHPRHRACSGWPAGTLSRPRCRSSS